MKFKNFKNIVLLLLTIFFICINFCGCKKSKTKNLISYAIKNNVYNLDPQTATSFEEMTIITNIFEGLYKKNSKGEYIKGAVENLDVDLAKKKYIFTLKNNIFWRKSKSDNEHESIPVTAKDFVFAFRRLLSPEVDNPFASDYFFIKNAQKVKQKELPIDKLGVKVNKKNQLIIYTEYMPKNITQLMSCCCTVPCNEEFFNSTNGRYGTCIDKLIINGPFFLSSWDQEQGKIRIRRNDLYYNSGHIKIVGINFSVIPEKEHINLLQEKTINTAILDGKEFESLDSSQYSSTKFQNSTIGIVFNKNSNFFKHDKIPKALAYDIDKNRIQSKLDSHQFIANNIVPPSVAIGQNLYSDIISNSNCCPNFLPVDAKKMFDIATAEIKSKDKKFDMNSYSILAQTNTYPILNQVLQTWQKDLGLFLKVDLLPQDSYIEKLKNKDFDSAIITINSEYSSPNSILACFLKENKNNYANYDIENLEQLIQQAANNEDINSSALKYFDIEKFLCSEGYFIPLYFQNEYLVCQNNIKDILFTPSNRQLYFEYSHLK